MPLKQNVRAIGKPGGRPKRRLSISKKWSLREFADLIVNDSVVQQQILKQARAGTLPPRVLAELFRYYGGRPPSEPVLPHRRIPRAPRKRPTAGPASFG